MARPAVFKVDRHRSVEAAPLRPRGRLTPGFHRLNAVHDATLTGGDVAVILIPSVVAAALLISLWVFTLVLYAVGRIKVG